MELVNVTYVLPEQNLRYGPHTNCFVELPLSWANES